MNILSILLSKVDLEKLRTVGIIGFGRSGYALMELFLKLGKRVKISEEKELSNFSPYAFQKGNTNGVSFEFGGHSKQFLRDCQLLIISPGVAIQNSAIISISQELAIPLAGEIEVASWVTPARIVALTGTNGKTTTTYLTYLLLKQKQPNVYLAGNIGIPLSSCALQTKPNDIIVVEVSSFQLETICTFRPYIAALLNVTPDHLDRYESYDEYVMAKSNIFRNQQSADWAVLSESLKLPSRIMKGMRAQIRYFHEEFGNQNWAAAATIAGLLGVSEDLSVNVFSQFKGLPHRMQHVATSQGILYINDSKATNPASTLWALGMIDAPIILIAGGKDKGVDYSEITAYRSKLKKVNLIGEAASVIAQCLADIPFQEFSSLEQAVKDASMQAREGDTVLFSPMCASFDMFRNYRERGEQFVKLVKEIIKDRDGEN